MAVLILRDARTRVRPCGSTCACALLRMRTSIAFQPSSRCQTAFSFPRRVFAPGVCEFCFTHPERGVGGAPRNVRVLGEAPVGRIMTRYARRLARRLASHDAGRSPLGAPP